MLQDAMVYILSKKTGQLDRNNLYACIVFSPSKRHVTLSSRVPLQHHRLVEGSYMSLEALAARSPWYPQDLGRHDLYPPSHLARGFTAALSPNPDLFCETVRMVCLWARRVELVELT
jgi:hypothetical protein